jgi:hypothetical protein
LHYPVSLGVGGGTMMLCMRYVWALAAGCLLAPAPAHPASGQLVLSCKDEAKSRGMEGASRTSDQAFLVFDFDRDLLFHDRTAGGTPIDAVKKYFITWKSDDGTRAGYLNRVTLEAVEQDVIAKTTYACALYAQLSFKAAEP